MDKKKLTPKQIFRTLAFHYHYDQKIPLQILCDMVSGLYYPRDQIGEARGRYKNLLISLMKEFSNNEKYMNQEQFCAYMAQMSKLKKQQYSLKLTERIFNRFSQIDPDSKQKVINLQQFKLIAQILKIRAVQAQDYFKNISDRKNQIDFQIFNMYMNSVVMPARNAEKTE